MLQQKNVMNSRPSLRSVRHYCDRHWVHNYFYHDETPQVFDTIEGDIHKDYIEQDTYYGK